ncbi:DUF4232 domain-containing protein [Actinopolyspora halophila]|uniref:DUF4232 domain-containing protein n=1 Tax=Actinopolyspora halophila TaxID=1850 RepID=UPI00037B8E75|nr:DUF4232 domain-containing protein [Actinopolyspora halophila]
MAIMRTRGIVVLLPLIIVGCAAHPSQPDGQASSTSATADSSETSVPSTSDRTASPPPDTPTDSVTADCPDTGVRLTTDLVETAMGLRLMHVELTNCGDRPYALNGYPGVRVLNEDRQPLDVRTAQGSADIASVDGFDAPPEAITVRPGEHAESQLMWRNTNTSFDAPAVGTYLNITPARGRPWQPVIPVGRERNPPGQDREEITVDLGSTGEIGIRAWH